MEWNGKGMECKENFVTGMEYERSSEWNGMKDRLPN